MRKLPEIHYFLNGMIDMVTSTIPAISFHRVVSFVQDPAGICSAINNPYNRRARALPVGITPH